jgi:hypothetical protein
MTRQFIAAAALSLVLAVPAAHAQAAAAPTTSVQVRQALALPWTVGSEKQLAAAFANTEQVTGFLRELMVDPPNEFDYVSAAEYRFVDLEGNGTLSLVATVNTGGRVVNSLLVVVSKAGGRFVYDIARSNGIELSDLPAMVVDLGHDGHKQLLVRTMVGEYKGARPTATFTHVYKLVSGKLYRADLEYRQYYAALRAPALKKRLAEVESQTPLADSYAEQSRRDEIAALRQEAEMIERTIGN